MVLTTKLWAASSLDWHKLELGHASTSPAALLAVLALLALLALPALFVEDMSAVLWFARFNRIQVEVLSVIAQQMLTVTQARLVAHRFGWPPIACRPFGSAKRFSSLLAMKFH